jgi:polyphosphate kinase
VGDGPYLDPDLGLLAFIERVMALAGDARVPLLERVRFLAISGGCLDEFYMVRVSELRREELRARWRERASHGEVAEERRGDARGATEQLAAIRVRAAEVHEQQSALRARALRDLAASGIRLLAWRELTVPQQEGLRAMFRERIHARLITSAVTLAPGHPFPRAPHLTLSLAVVGRDRRTETWHVSQLDLPRDVERFAPVPGSEAFVPVEEVVRANIDALYPELEVEGVFAFRLTRGGELPLEDELAEDTRERAAHDALEVVAEATRRRPYNAVVRVEVERDMPWSVRRIILSTLRQEPGVSDAGEAEADVYESEGPLGIASMAELAELPRADLSFPPFRGRDALDPTGNVAEQVAERDRVLHHP